MFIKILLIALLFTLNNPLQAKEYPTLALGVQAVSGTYIGAWERDKFLDGLEKELSRRGHIQLERRAPFLLAVRISGYSKNFGKATGKFMGSKQYRFKQSVRLQARYEVFDTRGRELYHGTLPYNVRMDTGSSLSYQDAMMKARESMLEGLGERVGERINERFHFMVDFEDQMDGQYGSPQQKKKKSSAKRSGSAKLSSGMSLDFESGKVSQKSSWGDVKWEAFYGKNDMHFFKPLHKARFAVFKGKSYMQISKNDVKRKKLSALSITVFDRDKSFRKGTVLVFKTQEGHYGKMKIMGFSKRGAIRQGTLHLQWQLF